VGVDVEKGFVGVFVGSVNVPVIVGDTVSVGEMVSVTVPAGVKVRVQFMLTGHERVGVFVGGVPVGDRVGLFVSVGVLVGG